MSLQDPWSTGLAASPLTLGGPDDSGRTAGAARSGFARAAAIFRTLPRAALWEAIRSDRSYVGQIPQAGHLQTQELLQFFFATP